MPTVTMSRERRLLLDILLKECEKFSHNALAKLGCRGPSTVLGTVIQDGGPRAECRDTEPSSVIQDGGKGAMCRDTELGSVSLHSALGPPS